MRSPPIVFGRAPAHGPKWPGVRKPLAQRHYHPVLRLGFAVATIVLCAAALEMALRYRDWPRTVTSGWRVSAQASPSNQFGWHGQPARPRRQNEFVIVMTGGAAVECLACPPGETLDVMLEHAVRRFNPNVRVVTMGATGYGQDQEYLALHDYFSHDRADLVINWASIADDVPTNTFRSGPKRPGQPALKPTFAWRNNDILGPTEGIGDLVYHSKLSALIWPLFIDIDRNWTVLLPKADPGSDAPPRDIQARSHVDDPLEQQHSNWSIWLTPRPERVTYGIELTHGLFLHMRELARLSGARFAILLTPSPADMRATAPIALEHKGHWFVADPRARDSAIAAATDGFDQITLPPEDETPPSPDAERHVMARLAEALNEREMLKPAPVERQRH